MYIKNLSVQNFRSFSNLNLNFAPELNIILGNNAKGKTTILEAIHLLCLARSFRTRRDFELCQFERANYHIAGTFVFDNKIERKVSVSYSNNKGRSISVDGKKILSYSDLIGNFPAVALSTQDHRITTGPPADRRKFADILLCQLSKTYLLALKDYIRVLKQKNKILLDISKGRKVTKDEIEPWNYELAQLSKIIMMARLSLCQELTVIFTKVYQNIVNSKNKFEIKYLPNFPFKNGDTLAKDLLIALKETELREKKMGFCLIGPHRDDFLFSINSRDLRYFGSSGEHKTALIALKAAEIKIIYERKNELPILLLDDLFSELDEKRSNKILKVFDKGTQILITSTHADKVKMDLFSKTNVFDFNSQKIMQNRNENSV